MYKFTYIKLPECRSVPTHEQIYKCVSAPKKMSRGKHTCHGSTNIRSKLYRIKEERTLTWITRTGHLTNGILSMFCRYKKNQMQVNGKKGLRKRKLLTLYMSYQYVCFTWYITLKPDKIGRCTTTALKRGKREAKSKVGPLPTDWP